MGRPRKYKYKNENERKAAYAAYLRKWREEKREKIRAAQQKYHKKRAGLPNSHEERLAALEAEVKDILLDLEECLKENKRIADLIKWGRK